ncbi:MAG: Sec-independent protein translocase protein TatB [Desulfovibrio sp.]|nr:Sec-independent protein translocase protein TatB [Desulfovibrio sp.]
MFGIGGSEFLVIIVVAILVLGPEHLPRIVRTVSRVMSDFRRVSTEFQRALHVEADRQETEEQKRRRARKTKPGAASPGGAAAPEQSASQEDKTPSGAEAPPAAEENAAPAAADPGAEA